MEDVGVSWMVHLIRCISEKHKFMEVHISKICQIWQLSSKIGSSQKINLIKPP